MIHTHKRERSVVGIVVVDRRLKRFGSVKKHMFQKAKRTHSPVVTLVLFDDCSGTVTLGEFIVIVGVAKTAASSHSVDMRRKLKAESVSKHCPQKELY